MKPPTLFTSKGVVIAMIIGILGAGYIIWHINNQARLKQTQDAIDNTPTLQNDWGELKEPQAVPCPSDEDCKG